jgi:hypothetical protein
MPDRPVKAGKSRSLPDSPMYRLTCVQACRPAAQTDLLRNWSGDRSAPFSRLQSPDRSWRLSTLVASVSRSRPPPRGRLRRRRRSHRDACARRLSGGREKNRVRWHRRRLRQRLRLRHRLRRRQRSTVGPQRQLEMVDMPTLILTSKTKPQFTDLGFSCQDQHYGLPMKNPVGVAVARVRVPPTRLMSSASTASSACWERPPSAPAGGPR